MSISIVYTSQTGNTKLLAEAIFNLINKRMVRYFGIIDPAALDADVILAGFPTQRGDCPQPMQELLGKMKNKKVALFGTAGFGGSKEYFDKILNTVASHLPETCQYLGGFMCQGKMQPNVRERYLSMLQNNPQDERIKAMIENFDRALPHPNETDVKNMLAWLKTLPLV